MTTVEVRLMRLVGLIFLEKAIHQHVQSTEKGLPKISSWSLTVSRIFSLPYFVVNCSKSVLYFSLETRETLRLERSSWIKYLGDEWSVLKQGLNLWCLKLLWLFRQMINTWLQILRFMSPT